MVRNRLGRKLGSLPNRLLRSTHRDRLGSGERDAEPAAAKTAIIRKSARTSPWGTAPCTG